MNEYLSAVARVIVVAAAVVGWLIVVPVVDLLTRRSDRLGDVGTEIRIARLPRAEAA